MSTGGSCRKLSAAVVFASRFGTTEVVARAFERGLKEAGVETFCARTSEFPPQTLGNYDLICLGGPTEVFTATKQVKDFLNAMGGASMEGRFGFAFDTKLDSRMSGSAAKYIEHALDDRGLHMIAERESAIVTSRKEGGRIVGAVLRDGEESRFEQLGARVGRATEDALERIEGGVQRQA
jgi:flavodoxin